MPTHTIQECREACGGAGYMAENCIIPLRADTDVFITFEGDNHVLTELVAKELLTALRRRHPQHEPRGMGAFRGGNRQ
jgi:acyl-CoA oxidase